MDQFKKLSKLIFSSFLAFSAFTLGALPLRADLQPNYFSDPKLFSLAELAEELKQKTLDMCWQFGPDSHFRFVSGGDEVYFEICLDALSESNADLITRVGHKFIKREAPNQLLFSYKLTKEGSEEFYPESNASQERDANQHDYIATERRVVEGAYPQHLDQDALVTIIKEKNILFYTGAGLSCASDIPAMSELKQWLGLGEEEKFLSSLEKTLENPRELAERILAFHRACLFSPPTRAHLALKELAVFKNTRIVTENLDCLHEASGVYPYRIDPNHLRDEASGISLESFDYMICIGLSYDDRGFLGWYKQQNPQGKIIAIDLKQPSYLGEEDFLLLGDLQEIIPTLQKAIIQ